MTTAPMTASISAAVPRIVAALTESPGLGAHEVATAVGFDRRQVADLLRRLHAAGVVVAVELSARPRAGRPARIYFVAPEGTPPRPRKETRAEVEERRRRARIAQQQRRALQVAKPVYRSLPLPAWQADTEPACQDADPGLFFGPEIEGPQTRAQRVAAAKAVCAGCAVRTACLDGALARGERWGIWGGADLETERRQRSPQAARPGVTAPGRT